MVTKETIDKADMLVKASQEMLDAYEKLLHDVRLEIPKTHYPIRRALALYDPVESNQGSIITFRLYKKVLKDIENSVDRIFGQAVPLESDLENDGFSRQVQDLVDSGVLDEDSALGGLSGAFNMDTLREGLTGVLEGILNDLNIPASGIGSESGPVSDYMSAGLPDTTIHQSPSLNYITKDAIDKLKNMAKASAGIQTNLQREQESGPAKIAKYAAGRGMANLKEYSPAKIWHAWVMYPELRGINLRAKEISTRPPQRTSPKNIRFDFDGEVDFNSDKLAVKELEAGVKSLREQAVIMTSRSSTESLCCIIGILSRFQNLSSILETFYSVMDVSWSISEAELYLKAPDFGNLYDKMKAKMLGKIIDRIEDHFESKKEFLRDIYQKILDFGDKQIEEGVGKDIIQCLPLDAIFDGQIAALNQLRDYVITLIRKFSAEIVISRNKTKAIQYKLADRARMNEYRYILGEMEKIASFVHDCGLDEDVFNRRAVDLIGRMKINDNLFNYHVKGQPLPAGMDPDYPLANLEGFTTDGGYRIEPGIQGSGLPTGELEELFRVCRSEPLKEFDKHEILRAMIKRRRH